MLFGQETDVKSRQMVQGTKCSAIKTYPVVATNAAFQLLLKAFCHADAVHAVAQLSKSILSALSSNNYVADSAHAASQR